MSFEDEQFRRRAPAPGRLSTLDWEQRIGEQLRRARLAAGYDQAELAELADTSVGALRNLERGNGSTVRTLVRIARSLGLQSWLDSIAPAATVSPIDVLKAGRRDRRRVYRARGASARPPALPTRPDGDD